MTRFVATRRGVRVQLGPAEVAILGRIPSLLGSVGADAADPAVRRLHPPAYADDGVASAELMRLTDEDLAAQRAADVEVFGGALRRAVDGVELTEDHAEAWLRVLGSARIVLAARRGLFELDDLSEASTRDPDVALVGLLGLFQQELAEALLGSMRPA